MPEVIFTGAAGRIEGRYHPAPQRNAPQEKDLVGRFTAVDANAYLILRAMVSPPCSEGPTVIKSPHGLSAGAPTLPRMG